MGFCFGCGLWAFRFVDVVWVLFWVGFGFLGGLGYFVVWGWFCRFWLSGLVYCRLWVCGGFWVGAWFGVGVLLVVLLTLLCFWVGWICLGFGFGG